MAFLGIVVVFVLGDLLCFAAGYCFGRARRGVKIKNRGSGNTYVVNGGNEE